MNLQTQLQVIRDRNAADAQRFKNLDEDTCMLCGCVGPDKRTLQVECFYQISEVAPDFICLAEVEGKMKGDGYLLRICKECRGKFLAHVKDWTEECKAKRGKAMDANGVLEPSNEADIPVRVNGAIQWMTLEQYETFCKRKEKH